MVQLRPKAPFLYGWCGTEYSFQTPRWCGSMAEQLICNQQVVGSTPTTSSKRGKIPEWPKGADCKSVGTAFGGSNPPLPTKKQHRKSRCCFFCGKGVSARFTPRGALRLNHLFRCWTLRYACKHARSRSYTNPPLSKKSRCCYFFAKESG